MKNLIPLSLYNLIFLMLTGGFAQVQQGAEDLYVRYIDYKINSGQYIPKFVLSQPYEYQNDIFKTGDIQKHYLSQKPIKEDTTEVILWTRLQALDEYRYADNDGLNRYRFDGTFYYSAPHITLMNRTTVDRDYRRDPLFAGDLSESENWLYGRVNEAYVNLSFGTFNLFFGRTERNWGAPNEYSLILSNWPYTYDHLLFSYTYKKLRLSVIFARLEKLNALDDTRPGEIIANANKFLTGHRLDLAFSKSFQLAFTEMAMYGGPERDFEPSFLNPMTFYYPLQRNDRLLMNGSWAVDGFYKPFPKLTLYTQFLIDDVIVNNEPGVDDRANYPDRFALITSVRTANSFVKGLNTSLTYVRVWNRTYQSRRTWENYHYRQLSLGYPCASCEEVKLKLEYWNLFPIYISNTSVYGRYGSVNLTDLFPVKHENFPLRPVKYSFLNELYARYFINHYVQTYLKIRYTNWPDHYLNRIEKSKGWIFKFGLNLNLGTELQHLIQ